MARSAASTLLILILASFATANQALADGSWAAFRGSYGTGEAVLDLSAGEDPLVLDTRWKRPLGSGYSGIAIADKRLVTLFAGDDRDYTIALDRDSGEELWRYDLAPTYGGHDGSHDGPLSTPAIADGRVFAVSPWGQVAAVDLETGDEVWTRHLVDDLECEKPLYGFGSSPRVVDDTMVLQIGGEAGSVAGFDVATGEVRWRVLQDEVAAQSPMLADIAGHRQVLVLGSKLLAGIDPTDGTVLWQLEHGGKRSAMGSHTASPLPIGNDRILAKLDEEKSVIVEVVSQGESLSASIAETTRGMTKSYSPPSGAGQKVIGYTARFLSAIDAGSGDLLWRSRQPGDGFQIVIGDYLAVITKKGTLHLGQVGPDGMRETSRLDLFDDLAWTPPSYDAGSIFVRSHGEIARIDLILGTPAMLAAVEPTLPAALAGLAEAVATTDDPAAEIDAFLEGKDLPLIKGREVVFLWRGEAQDLAIAGDMIGMRREEPMHRLEGTDLWWWATEIDPRARLNYLFYVDYEPTLDPTHERVVESSILGPDMNWRRNEGLEMSWFAMPQWPGLRLLKAADAQAGSSAGTLDTLEMVARLPADEEGEEPEPLQLSIPVWLPPGYEDSDTRYPAVYVANETAREAGDWPGTLDRVVGSTVAPLIAVFLELPPLPPPVAGQIFVSQIVPTIDERYRTIADREHRANVGMGWPGFGAAMDTFSNSSMFGALGIQSFFSLEETMNMLTGAIGDRDASSLPLNIYLEWGRWDLVSPHEEMNMRDSSKWAWDLFRDRGWEPVGGEVWDSTDWGSWRNRTGVMLEALFPMEGADSSQSAWQTSAQ